MGLRTRSYVYAGEFKRIYPPIDYNLSVAVGADPSAAAVIPARAGYTICLQRITFNVTTDAARSLVVRDDATTPLVAASFKSSPGVGTFYVDYGDEGMMMTEGKQIDIAASGAGLVGTLVISGYYLPTGTFTPSTV
jgi:hypothetical protein